MEMMCWGGDAMVMDVLNWCWGVICQKAKGEIPILDCLMLPSSLGSFCCFCCCRCCWPICEGQLKARCKKGLRDLHDGAAATRRAWREVVLAYTP